MRWSCSLNRKTKSPSLCYIPCLVWFQISVEASFDKIITWHIHERHRTIEVAIVICCDEYDAGYLLLTHEWMRIRHDNDCTQNILQLCIDTWCIDLCPMRQPVLSWSLINLTRLNIINIYIYLYIYLYIYALPAEIWKLCNGNTRICYFDLLEMPLHQM